MNISFFTGDQRLTSQQSYVFFVYSLYSLSSYLSHRSVLTLLFICQFKLNAFRPADYKLLKISTDNKYPIWTEDTDMGMAWHGSAGYQLTEPLTLPVDLTPFQTHR